MELYLILNGIISLAAVLALNARQLNYRNKLYFGIFALICWFLPLQLLSSMRSTNLFIPVISELVPALFIPQLHYFKFMGIPFFTWLISSVCLLGFFKFLYDYRQHTHQVNLLERHSETTQMKSINGKSVRISDTSIIKGAMTSGIFSPVIWIGSSIQSGKQREAVILHESTHIKNKDPLVLFVLHFIECLLWWNPLAQVVSSLSKQHIELSCDEQCKKELGLECYKKHLATLVLAINERDVAPMAAHFSSTSDNFNIARIKRLSEYRVLSWSNYLKYIFTSLVIFTLILLFIRSGQTGLDGKRINILRPVSASTWDVRMEQFPMRSLGIIGVEIGLNGSYVHSDIVQKFYYMNIRNATVDEIVQEFSNNTIAIARVINNVLYVMPDSLENKNDLSWVLAEGTTYFAPKPEEKRQTWHKYQLYLKTLAKEKDRLGKRPPD